MSKTFKKGQLITAILPGGKKVVGHYLEPYGSDGHSFIIDEFSGLNAQGEPTYIKKRYGVKESFIEPFNNNDDGVSESQYKAWLKRAILLKARIDEDTNSIDELKKTGCDDTHKSVVMLMKKIKRGQQKLDELNKKIEEFEG